MVFLKRTVLFFALFAVIVIFPQGVGSVWAKGPALYPVGIGTLCKFYYFKHSSWPVKVADLSQSARDLELVFDTKLFSNWDFGTAPDGHFRVRYHVMDEKDPNNAERSIEVAVDDPGRASLLGLLAATYRQKYSHWPKTIDELSRMASYLKLSWDPIWFQNLALTPKNETQLKLTYQLPDNGDYSGPRDIQMVIRPDGNVENVKIYPR